MSFSVDHVLDVKLGLDFGLADADVTSEGGKVLEYVAAMRAHRDGSGCEFVLIEHQIRLVPAGEVHH